MQGKYSESIVIFEKAIAIEPGDANLHANLGFSLSKIGDWDNAIKHYRITLDIDPDHERTRYNLRQAIQKVAR